MKRINCEKIRKLINGGTDENLKPLSPHKLSKELDISRDLLVRMSNDPTYNPGVLTIERLSEYFNVRIDDLLIKD